MEQILRNLKSFALANRRLIVPGIGAFLTKDTGNGGKKIIFSSFLKYDDGLLEKLLMKKENLSETEAKRLIQDFSNEVSATIESGKTFAVADFGFFGKDNHGVNIFTTENKNAEELQSAVEEKPVAEPILNDVEKNESTEEEHIETPAESKQEEPKSSEIAEKEETTNPEAEEKTDTEKEKNEGDNEQKTETNNVLNEPEKTEEQKPIVAPKTKYESPKIDVEEKEKPVKVVVPQNQDSEKKNRNVGFWILLAILLLVLLAVLMYFFNDSFKSKIKSFICNDGIENVETMPLIPLTPATNTTKIDTTKLADSIKNIAPADTASTTQTSKPTSQNVEPATPQQQVKPTVVGNDEKKYQVVAGCFIYKNFAEELVAKLQAQGLSPYISQKLQGELYPVIAGESDNVEEAKQVRLKCVQLGYDAWIRKSRR